MADPADAPAPAAPAPGAGKPKRGELVDVTVERIEARGRGVATCRGATLVMRNGVPGATVRARVLRRVKGKRLECSIEEVLEPGPHSAPPRCPHAGTCGGCAMATVAYGEQLRQKRALVVEALAAGFDDADEAARLAALLGDVVPAERLEGYRNKMDFTFGARRYVLPEEPQGAEAGFALGLHVPRLHQKVLDIDHCAIAFPGASELVRDVRTLAKRHGLEPWDLRDHTGLLRHLVVRRGVRTAETMVHLVTSERAAERIDPLVADLLAMEREHPITTVVQGVTRRASTVAVGDESHVLHGPGTIDEVLMGTTFRISAHSFFQTNTEQAERLFGIVRDFAGVGPGTTLFDLYCGAGTIGLCIGQGARRVVGIETVESAVADARDNAARAGASRAEFHAGDALALMERLSAMEAPDVLVLDPPRAGLHPKVHAPASALGAPRIVFVSCNPKTGARDVAELCRGGYRVDRIAAVDLFPHTPHVEVVFGLSRTEAP